MMGSQREEEEDQFFDASGEVASVSDSLSDCSGDCCSCSEFPGSDAYGLGYELWMEMPETAHQRRSRFRKWMGLRSDQDQIEEGESGETLRDDFKIEFNRPNDDNRAVLRTKNLEDHFSHTPSTGSYCSKEADLFEEDAHEGSLISKIKNLDSRTECVNGVTKSGMLSGLLEVGSNRAASIDELQRTHGSSSLDRWLLRRDVEADKLVDMKNKMKSGWFRTLFTKAHAADRQRETDSERNSRSDASARLRKVQVHTYRKKLKELSSLYEGQEFAAHEGSILTMKFSPDGQYLASAGEDGIVRVWKVIEHEKPSKVFWIIEKPLHEFHGHSGDVLSLAWSNNGYLLSSSVDKTVRLWQVGHERCLGVFFHNNYVTCVEFNPVDDTYFISGSIDGKVRIWEVRGCRVVDWIDIRDIVTAVCYYPNGKGGIVGSMDGSCRFYDIIDNRLQQLDAQISLQGKKKLPLKRITGFQFSPSDPSKVLVTSADSQVRVLCGLDVVFKFKGRRISGSQIGVAASFTGDGKHVVSASDGANVCIWDSSRPDRASKPKTISSCESFISHNASIAIPWWGMKTTPGSPSTTPSTGDEDGLAVCVCIPGNEPCDRDSLDSLTSSPAHNCFSLTKGTATWPEENLPNSSPVRASPAVSKSEHNKLLKSGGGGQHPHISWHLWGLVIVTAGWDGRIRTYHNYGLPIRL
ncbi:uncharacterized protein LOC127812920 isoform X2 [Diospyros lotus]|uniref:uncharacterized protein LOC127812920 isoform X2 n=1 Tax=Diospyros lotus TaxID=55363 RepID=UPI00224F9D4E|nr:uncharacterized protein LOC127812920 isoform X2 [Diospyros lotus]